MSFRTFYFDTGVQQGTLGVGHALVPGYERGPNGVLRIPFRCADVPEGAGLRFLCDNPELPESHYEGVIVRELAAGSAMISRYAYFDTPTNYD